MTAPGVERVTERALSGSLPIWTHPGWTQRFPWLTQGITSGGTDDSAFDLGLFGATPSGVALGRWRRLREELGFRGAVHSRQVHGERILRHAHPPPEGLLVVDGYDGHVTGAPGLLLTASVADCVPVTLVDPGARVVAVVHAGWRGVAAGIVEVAVEMLRRGGGDLESLAVHCGPAICGNCYEVGPEVHRAVHPDREPPATPTPIDLRSALAERVTRAGVRPAHVSVSTHCTRCGGAGFFSHRAGSTGRQMAFAGARVEG